MKLGRVGGLSSSTLKQMVGKGRMDILFQKAYAVFAEAVIVMGPLWFSEEFFFLFSSIWAILFMERIKTGRATGKCTGRYGEA